MHTDKAVTSSDANKFGIYMYISLTS